MLTSGAISIYLPRSPRFTGEKSSVSRALKSASVVIFLSAKVSGVTFNVDSLLGPYGDHLEGACGNEARMTLSAMERSFADFPKYTLDARSIPCALFPNGILLR